MTGFFCKWHISIFYIPKNSIATIQAVVLNDSRYLDHKTVVDPTSFTSKADDWEPFLIVENLEYKQARKIEIHVKKMKSAKYISNLKKFPEIMEKLKCGTSKSWPHQPRKLSR